MTNRLKWILIVGAAVTVIAVGGTLLAGAIGGGHGERDAGRDDRPVTGALAEQVRVAALKSTGGGRVLEVELDGDLGAGAPFRRKRDDADSSTVSEGGPDNERDLTYEVTVEQPNGKLVEVQLPKDL